MNTTYIKTNINNKTVEIAEWVIRKNGNPMTIADIAGNLLEIAKETEKAIFFQGTMGGFWAPKSQVRMEA